MALVKSRGPSTTHGVVNGAENGHGTGAKHDRGRDQPIGEQSVFRLEHSLDPVAQPGHAAFDVAQFADDRPGQKAYHDQERRGHGQGHLEPDEDNGQAQGLEHNGAHPVGKPAVQQKPKHGADNDGRAIDQGTHGDHAEISFCGKAAARQSRPGRHQSRGVLAVGSICLMRVKSSRARASSPMAS